MGGRYQQMSPSQRLLLTFLSTGPQVSCLIASAYYVPDISVASFKCSGLF